MAVNRRGRVVVIGAGPAGMAAALSLHQAGHEVVLLERYPQARPAGNILNLWPPPIKALGLMGVDTADLGAPCRTEFRSIGGNVRVRVRLPEEVIRDYGGGFIGLLRPDLYERLLAALPSGVLRVNRTVEAFEQDASGVHLRMADGEELEADVLVGADGIDSLVRRTLWGESPKREHRLHIFGGYTFADAPDAERGLAVLSHSRTVQGSWTAIRSKGRDGYQWWMLAAHDPERSEAGVSLARPAGGFEPDRADNSDTREEGSGRLVASEAGIDLRGDGETRVSGSGRNAGNALHEAATALADGFAAPLPGLIAATEPANVQRWVLRDRKPLTQWSKGRVTLVGDAAHPTSPYAAYGAGMATEDGYFLGRRLGGVDLSDFAAVREALQRYEAPRKPHTARQVQQAWALGKVFHHAPAWLRPLRDAVLDHTPFLQKVVGESSPGEIVAQLAAIDEAEAGFVRRAD